MEEKLTIRNRRAPSLNPWFIVVLTGIAPLILFLFVFYKWYHDKEDFRRVTSHFMQRQNKVMAYDAVEVAVGFGDLLEKAGRDVMLLDLFTPTPENLMKFYKAQLGDYTKFSGEDTGVQEPLPFYNRISYLKPNGDMVLHLFEGKVDQKPRPLSACEEKDLCDRRLLEAAAKMSPGSLYYGRVMRYYSAEGEPEQDSGSGLSVAYHTEKGIYVLTIDYRHLKDHLSFPSFPYDSKKNLLEAYQRGNYLFIVDNDNNIITHPHYWKSAGIDKKTGKWVTPMKSDADSGTHPINIAAYEKGVLFDYFQRLLNVSFKQKGVDIFRATNLMGTIRILSVAPVVISKGQFGDSGIFGHVIITCNIEYFEEPKEMIVPYY